jgi:preprotein translocase subunit SecA
MNQQRELVYSRRRHAISEEGLSPEIFDIMENLLDGWLGDWDGDEEYIAEFCKKLRIKFLLNAHPGDFPSLNKDEIIKKILEAAKSHYARKEKLLGEEKTRNLEKMVFLGVIDSNWKDYLFNVDQLREGIMWRSYGQKDPLVEYQHEAFAMFTDLIATIDEEIAERLFKTFAVEEKFTRGVFRPERESFIHEEYSALEKGPEGPSGKDIPSPMPDMRPAKEETYRRKAPKVGRNDPCPCGSGLKYKKCCGK